MNTKATLIFLFALAYAAVAVLMGLGYPAGWLLLLLMPLTLLLGWNLSQRSHSILRNYPLLGYLRYAFESIRPEIHQYFVESDLNGKPFNRRQRSLVYQRAKNVRQTVPFGMQADSKEIGFEWMSHTLYPVKVKEESLRVTIGNRDCRQPYSSSLLNISAMSYGSLSKNAVLALNGGAKLGGFAHNTGEGGVAVFHLQEGGDVIWQIGTGYFGCRNAEGGFDDGLFAEQAMHPNIKMVEIKLSQGAKPGHGGILPAEKNTPEIAAIRKVHPYTQVVSPPGHSAFRDANGLLLFVKRLRDLSGGKPVGIKLCIGELSEFEAICQEMKATGIAPDYIAIDGAEGGTGAAPPEFTDNVGMPLYDALAAVHGLLLTYGVRGETKLVAAGRIVTAFDMVRVMALGADLCYSARGMMFALGCIQALQCDSGKCPVGVATQDKSLQRGLDVTDKRVRVANFHRNTLKALVELLEAGGYDSPQAVKPEKLYRRVSATQIKTFDELYFQRDIRVRLEDRGREEVALN